MSCTYYVPNHHDAPSLNVANGNAYIPAEMMGVSFDEYYLHNQEFDAVLLRLKLSYAPAFHRETVQDGNITFCGVTNDQVEWYRSQLIKIVEYCREHKCDMGWG